MIGGDLAVLIGAAMSLAALYWVSRLRRERPEHLWELAAEATLSRRDWRTDGSVPVVYGQGLRQRVGLLHCTAGGVTLYWANGPTALPGLRDASWSLIWVGRRAILGCRGAVGAPWVPSLVVPPTVMASLPPALRYSRWYKTLGPRRVNAILTSAELDDWLHARPS